MVARDAILEFHAAGMHPAAIARKTGLKSPSWIAEVLRQHGIEPHCGVVKTAPATIDRMADLFRQGLSMAQIGAEFGITRERVRRHLKKLGLTGADGGASKRTPKVPKWKRRKEERSLSFYGLSCEEVKKWRAAGMVSAFNVHKKQAKERGIGFEMNFAQWIGVWLASGRLDQRGCGRGAYVMSRPRDIGPYSVENVRIVRWEDNVAEGAITGQLGTGRGWVAVNGRYQVVVANKHIGMFNTPEEARSAYLAACDSYREAFYASRSPNRCDPVAALSRAVAINADDQPK